MLQPPLATSSTGQYSKTNTCTQWLDFCWFLIWIFFCVWMNGPNWGMVKNCTRKMYNYLYPVMTYYDMALNLLAVGDIFLSRPSFLLCVSFLDFFVSSPWGRPFLGTVSWDAMYVILNILLCFLQDCLVQFSIGKRGDATEWKFYMCGNLHFGRWFNDLTGSSIMV